MEHAKTGPFPGQVVRSFSEEIRPMPMGSAGFETDVMGLILATLPLDAGYTAELPSVYGQLGEEYYIRPRVTGTQDFHDAEGRSPRGRSRSSG